MFEGSQNLSTMERAISVVAGLGLAAAATKPRPNPLLNVLALLGGSYLAMRGATGHCPVKQTMQSLAAPKLAASNGGNGSKIGSNGKRSASRSPAGVRP
jgi:uncharacterized membrane protein